MRQALETATRVVLWLLALACALPAPYAVWVVADDLRYRGEDYDGLGVALGGAVLAVTLLVGAPAALAGLWWRRRPRAAAVLGAWAGAALALSAVFIGVTPWVLASTATGVWLVGLSLTTLTGHRHEAPPAAAPGACGGDAEPGPGWGRR